MALENLTKITSVGISSHIALTGVTTVGFITSADAWVGGALTVGGNITIGGTVTYEDVTNIDSVGIITSQNGLRVTAGGINVTAGVSTYSGLVDVNNRIDVVGGANIDQANITGILTATTLIGALTTTDACQTGDLTIVNGNPDLRLKDSNHGGNNTEHIIAFQDSSGNNQMNIGSPFGEQHLRIKHGTTDLVKIQTDGRVGINTTSLAHVLQTQGSGNNGSVRIENSHTTLTVSGNTASSSFPHNLVLSNYSGSGNADNRMASIGFDIPTTSAHANATIAYQATNGSGNGDLQFWLEESNTSKERLRITSAGRVGINTNNPTEILDVRGDLVVAESLAVNRPRIVLSAPNDGTNYRHLFGANLQVNSSGTFTTPTANISGGGWEYLPANSLNAHGDIRYLSAPDTNATTSTPVERLRITSGGQLELSKDQDGVTGRPTNRIVFKDTDSSVAANQPIGEISWYSTDAGMTNVNSWIRGINEHTNGNGALLFGVKAAGSSEIEALRIDSGGRVGINKTPDTDGGLVQIRYNEVYTSGTTNLLTSASKAAFRIQTSSDSSKSLFFGGIDESATPYLQVGNKGSGGATATYPLILQPYGDKVGIGTDAPDTILHLSDSSADTKKLLTFNTGDNKRNNYIGINGNDNLEIGVDEDEEGGSSSLRLRVDATEVIRLESGMTGIRQTDPKATLHVKAHDNNWEAGLLLEDNTGNDGWNLHPESSDASLMIGYNDDTTVSLTSQSPTVVVKLHSGGNLQISNGDLVVANGHGVDFSASESSDASSGQSVLDDYEQGAFTAIMYGHTTGSGSSNLSGNGYYTKVGNVVNCTIIFSNKNGTALPTGEQCRIAGLPFNMHANGSNQTSSVPFTYNVAHNDHERQCFIGASSNSYLRGYRSRDNATWQPWMTQNWRYSQIYLHLNYTYLSTV